MCCVFLALAPRSRPLQVQHLTLAQGRTRHPQPLRPSSRSRAPERKVVFKLQVCRNRVAPLCRETIYHRLVSANQNSSSWQNTNTRRCATYAREQATPARGQGKTKMQQ
eukprot:scaffold59657_cov67-Phaeocystis_antarctica.AAC.2